jgi:hypothetical protein
MKNFTLGVFCGAIGMAYFTGNLKVTAEGISLTTDKPLSSEPSDPPVQPPTVEPYQPPPEPPKAA